MKDLRILWQISEIIARVGDTKIAPIYNTYGNTIILFGTFNICNNTTHVILGCGGSK